MKRRIFFGLTLLAVAGFVLADTSVTETAVWYGPEPSGIIAIKK